MQKPEIKAAVESILKGKHIVLGITGGIAAYKSVTCQGRRGGSGGDHPGWERIHHSGNTLLVERKTGGKRVFHRKHRRVAQSR